MLKIENFSKIIIANWKLYGSPAFVKKYLEEIRFNGITDNDRCVVICPPVTFINQFHSKNLFVGAQDCSIYSQGSYTGEISARILKNIGCQFCIIGHSERRIYFKDNYEIISKKLLNCLQEKIIPVFCIGENLQQKKEKLTKYIIQEQIRKCLPKHVNNKNTIIAYEPLWAIGTGITPNLEEISAIHKFIKKEIFGDSNLKILYGGSVKGDNCKDILNLEGVDGVLVGGASLNINEFNKIIKS